MAFYQARSGVCRSGVTYCGWTPPLGAITIAGVNQTANVLLDNFTFNARADGTPATLAFTTVPGFTPVLGQDVSLLYATPNDYLFQGRLLQMEAEKVNKTQVVWHCTAVGDQWLADRYDRVLTTYHSTGVNTMVADILARNTDGNFRVGYIDSALGNIDMDFTFETVVGALTRIAKASNAFYRITALDGTSRIVDMYQTYPEQAPITVTGDNTTIDGFSYKSDLTQVRTRVIFQGRGSTATVLTAAGSATIQIDDASSFLPGGGNALAEKSIITYTGVSTSPTASFLTGVSGLANDVAQGDAIDLIVVTIDAGATTALATRLGGGLSGQATNQLSDGRLSATESSGRSATDLATFDVPLEEATWRYVTVQRSLRPGQSVTLNFAVPVISGSFLVQSIQIVPIGKIGGQFTGFWQTATGARFVRTVTDLLSQLAG